MATSESIQEIYVSNFSSFVNREVSSDLTTVYEVGLFNAGGLNLFNVRLYSRFLPEVGNLDDYLEDSSDLKTGFYKAIQSFIETTSKTALREITGVDGRTTRFHKVVRGGNDYFITLTYDRNPLHYQETEQLIDNLFLIAERLIIDSKAVDSFEQTGNLSFFDDLTLSLIKAVNVGYNNKDSLAYIKQLQQSIEADCQSISFLGEEALNKARVNVQNLSKLKMLFPQLDIDVDYYKRSIDASYSKLLKSKQEVEELNVFRDELRGFGDYLLSLVGGDLRSNLGELAKELMFPSVLNGINNNRILALKRAMRSEADYLSNLLNSDLTDTLLEIEAIAVRDWVEGFMKKIPQLTNY